MKIVVRGTNWVGDAVMTIPALRELRRIFPDSKISLHTRSWTKGIFEDCDFIDEIIGFDGEKSSIGTTVAQARRWRSKQFDLAVLFTNSFETALLSRLAGVPRRFGYAKELRSFLLTDSIGIPDWKNEKHEIFYYLNLIAEIENAFFSKRTVLDSTPRFELDVSEEKKRTAREFLSRFEVDPSKNLICMVPGSTNSRAKRWGIERFAALNDLIQADGGSNVILIGSADESDVSDAIAEHSNRAPIVLTGKTSLAESIGIISLCDLVISNDTGPAHISAAIGIPTIVIFGPTNPKTTKPWNSEIIRENVECSPCMLRDCPIDHRCMTRIEPVAVFEKALSMIEPK